MSVVAKGNGKANLGPSAVVDVEPSALTARPTTISTNAPIWEEDSTLCSHIRENSATNSTMEEKTTWYSCFASTD